MTNGAGNTKWQLISEDLVPVNITCIQDAPETIYRVEAWSCQVDKILDVRIAQPGIITLCSLYSTLLCSAAAVLYALISERPARLVTRTLLSHARSREKSNSPRHGDGKPLVLPAAFFSIRLGGCGGRERAAFSPRAFVCRGAGGWDDLFRFNVGGGFFFRLMVVLFFLERIGD